MNKKLLSLTLSSLMAASSSSLTTVFAGKDEPTASEPGNTQSAKSAETMNVSAVPFTSAYAITNNYRDKSESQKSDNYADSTSSSKDDDKSKKSTDSDFHPDDSVYKSSKTAFPAALSPTEPPVAPPIAPTAVPPIALEACQNLYQVFLEKYAYCDTHKDYSMPDPSAMTEDTGWALVNKELPDFCDTLEGRKTIGGYNKYFRVHHNSRIYVMLLPIFGMVSSSGMPIEDVKRVALDPTKWEFKYFGCNNLATYNSQYRDEGLVNSLEQYINIITPRFDKKGSRK